METPELNRVNPEGGARTSIKEILITSVAKYLNKLPPEREPHKKVLISTPTLGQEQKIDRMVTGVSSSLEELREARGGNMVRLLEYGSKSLLLYFDLNSQNFNTYLAKTGEERASDETTLLYEEARRIMRAKATELQRTLEYGLCTNSQKMIDWANAKGADIFLWRRIVPPSSSKGEDWEFIADIEPNSVT